VFSNLIVEFADLKWVSKRWFSS